jgi:hypothetical protein
MLSNAHAELDCRWAVSRGGKAAVVVCASAMDDERSALRCKGIGCSQQPRTWALAASEGRLAVWQESTPQLLAHTHAHNAISPSVMAELSEEIAFAPGAYSTGTSRLVKG